MGYAEVMIAEARGIAPFLTSSVRQKPPLFSAPVTRPTTLFATPLARGRSGRVQGIGGLGHLGVQFARHMGFHTVAIGRGREKEKLAKDLGAHVYIDAAVDDPQRRSSVWAGPERFSQPPQCVRWGHWCLVLRSAAS